MSIKYDKEGDAHFDTISAFIKSVRGSDPDAALYWLARMVYAGEDPRFILRRLSTLASEDVGLADPNAIVVVNACAQAAISSASAIASFSPSSSSAGMVGDMVATGRTCNHPETIACSTNPVPGKLKPVVSS